MKPSKATLSVAAVLLAARSTLASGLLRVHSGNPRYVTGDAGQSIYLTGSHTWLNVQDAREPFDDNAYLDFLEAYNHHFTRLWAWESPFWVLPDSRVVPCCC